MTIVLQVVEEGGPGGVCPGDPLLLRVVRVNCQQTGPSVECDPGPPPAPGSVR